MYGAEVADENATHAMEHGAVWVTYRPGLDPAQVAALTRLVQGSDHALLSPYQGLDSPVSAQAWGRRLSVTSGKDACLAKFIDTYSNGPQTPEKGATCAGGVDTTGADPA